MRTILLLAAAMLATGITAQTVIWDNDCHPDTRETYAVAFSSDGTKVLSGSECDNARVRIWETGTGNLTWDNDIGSSLFCIMGVQMSASGSYFGVMEELGNVLIYDYTGPTPVLMHTIDLGVNASYSLDFSPDNTKLVADGSGGALRIYEVSSGTLVQTITGNMGTVFSVDFAPNGNVIAAGSQDNNVRLWNANDGSLLATLTGHTNDITSVRFSASGDHLVTASQNGQIKVWMEMMGGWMQHAAFTAPENVHQVDISDDEQYIVVGGFTQTYLYEAMTGQLLATFNVANGGDVYSVDFKPNAHDVVTGTSSGRVVLWGLASVLSVPERKALLLDVHPNPTADRVTVQLTADAGSGTLELFTREGRLVRTLPLGQATTSIDLADLAAGDYLLRVTAGERIGIRSITKQ